jgi:hypothetical protein
MTPRNGTLLPAFAVVRVYLTSALSLGLKITCDHSSALQPADDEVGVACYAPACLLLRLPARRITGPDFIEPRIGSTGADANGWNPPKQPA